MPTILEETEIKLERVDMHKRSPISIPVSKQGLLMEPSRAAGIHLSGVLRYVAVTCGLMKVLQSIEEEEDLPLRMAMGHAWEEFAASFYPDMAWQPGAISAGGISMTCDGHSFEPAFTIDEFKLTWKKVKTAEEMLRDEWYWQQQGRGYAWGYEALRVRWHVCYVNGNYRNSGPIYMRYLIEYTEKEIASTGRLLEKNKQAAVDNGYAEKGM